MTSISEDASRLAEQVLAAYKEDLWLKRCLQVDEVVARLEALIPRDPARRDAEEYIRELIKFLRFLESECSGRLFQTDKQWGELMNLMQISRKLNHKSVKFKDILKNRLLIEANARDIRRFNEFARSCCLIDEFIRAFETNLAVSHLTLWPTSSDSKNELEDESAATRSLNEILRAQRHAEVTLKPPVNNLRVYLRSELVVQKASAAQLETWTKRFDQFERVAQKLCHFLESFYNLKRELSLLRPLVESVVSSNSHVATEHSGGRNNSELLASSLASCRQTFKQILEFEQALEANLRTLVQRTSVATVPRSRLASSVPSNRSSKQDSTKKTSNQQVSPPSDLKLVKLLKPDKCDEFTSELYHSLLDQSLKRAVECRRSMDEMMATLRLEFGRFYFVNDLELLRIISLDSRLAQECDREDNKRLIRKLFNNSVETFLLSRPQLALVGVQTPAGEQILLAEGQDPVPLKKRVNIFSLEIVRILNELMRKLQRSLRTILVGSLSRIRLEFGFGIDWSLPIQLLGVAEQIKFTERVELALLEGNDCEQLLKEYEMRLKSLGADDQEVHPNTLTMQLKRSAMVSLTVHFISTLLALNSEPEVRSTNDWRWQKLARYYLSNSREVEVRIANSSFDYKFDLLPVDQNSPDDQATNASIKRLIYTKTSEHCFLVASQALGRLRLGANPYGPAGSGKTETVKALGQLLGCQVIVHNCDETNEAQALERLVWGLAHTGLWGCFDEFNRLSSSCLSSISALLELVQTNLRSGATTLQLDDGQIKSIDQASAFFVTMNPGDGAKYRGRRRLPANLRSLFLPVAMVQVQVESIVREMLLSYWSSSVEVAKLTNAHAAHSSLAERMGLGIAQWIEWMRAHLQVSRCEWDLRLVMNILKRFKRATSAAIKDQLGCDANELRGMLVECIAKEVQPRLSRSEFKILDESLQQIFKGLSVSRSPQLYHNKLQQLDDQLETRSGVILLGESQSGKTALWHCLIAQRNSSHDANNKLIRWFALNPKSCANSALFGSFGGLEFDATGIAKKNPSNKWFDGLFTKLVRNSIELLQNKEEVQQVWLVLDGPLDPDWIESLNSVLDDNQVLTLGSGERLNFVLSSNYGQKSIKLIFETDSVSCVSPATISRLGLLHLESGASAHMANAAAMQPNKLELTILHTDSSFGRVSTSLLLDHLKHESDTLHTLEYSCFEGSKSSHLIELLDLVRALEESNTEVKQDTTTLLLIHNLHLIQEEDKWRTRTFIELLRHLVAYGFYYDSEHNLHGIQDAKCAVTTPEPCGLGGRFRSLAQAVVKVAVASEIQETVLMFDELVQMIVHGPSLNLTHGSQSIALVKVSEHQEVQEVLINLHNALSLKQEDPSSAPMELYKFNNSSNILQSLAKLAKFARSQVDSQESGPGLASKRHVFLLDSLVWPLMTEDQQAELCHLLNLIKLKRLHPASLLILMLAQENNPVVSGFWCQINSASNFRLAQVHQVGSTQQSLMEYLTDKLDGGSMDLHWLTSWMVENRRPEFARGSYLQLLARMIASLSGHIAYQRRMLTTSLRRLADFEAALEEVKARRDEEEAALDRRRQEIEALLREINQEIAQAKSRSEQLNDLKRKQHEKTQELETSKRQIERELAEVEPMVKASKREVRDSLKPEALNEIKTLRLPSKTIKDILDVLFVLLQPEGSKPNLDWAHMKSYLARGTLRDELTNFDYQTRLASSLSSSSRDNNNSKGGHANSLGPASQSGGDLLVRVEREIELRRESFRLEQAARASSAIVPIVRWIQAALDYGRVLYKLGPLTESMQRCERETGELNETLARLEREQQEVDQRIAGERQRLAELERDYERARMESERVKLDLDRAQEIRSNLGDQGSRWRAKLTYYNEHLTSDEQLCRVCLACSLVALVSGVGCSRVEMLERVMNVHSLVSGIAKSSKGLDPIVSLAVNYLAPLLESVDHEDSSWSMVEFELMFSRSSEVASEEQLDHFVKLAIIKLNLKFDRDRLLVLRVAETQPTDKLCKYLSYKRFLCDKGVANLVLVKPMTDDNWRQTAEVTLQLGDKIALVEMPSLCTGADAEHRNLTLDILDFFGSLRDASASSRVILFVRSTPNLLLDSCELVSLIDIGDGSSGGRRQTGEDLERELANLLLELHEPQLSLNLSQLELELKRRQQEARQLESNLSKGLMSNESTSKTSAATLAPQNRLVRLLGDLNQSSKLLSGTIEGIQQKLQDLQAKRTRFTALVSRASAFYVEHLAYLKHVQYFYHLPPRRFAELLMISSVKDNEDWKYATIERVMCSLRPEDRNKRMFGLDELSLISLQQSASNLKQQLAGLVESMQDNKSNSFRLAIILHDAKRSSPQMEVDEFMSASGSCQYHKLYATTDPQVAKISRLEAQLERVMASNASSEVKCICITNAHLASQWLNSRLLEFIKRVREESEKLLVILVGEHEDGSEDGRALSANLLDEAHLKCWHNELGLPFFERFKLYKQLASQADRLTGDGKLADQLILFHVVCQELTKSNPLLNKEDIWQRPQNYAFDREQLVLAFKVLKQICSCDSEQKQEVDSREQRATLCNYLEAIVYGARMETKQDEQHLRHLMDKFLRSCESAHRKLSSFGRGLMDDKHQPELSDLIAS